MSPDVIEKMSKLSAMAVSRSGSAGVGFYCDDDEKRTQMVRFSWVLKREDIARLFPSPKSATSFIETLRDKAHYSVGDDVVVIAVAGPEDVKDDVFRLWEARCDYLTELAVAVTSVVEAYAP